VTGVGATTVAGAGTAAGDGIAGATAMEVETLDAVTGAATLDVGALTGDSVGAAALDVTGG